MNENKKKISDDISLQKNGGSENNDLVITVKNHIGRADSSRNATADQNSPENKNDDNKENKLMEVPVLTLNNTVLFPYALSPLIIHDEQSIRTIENTAQNDRLIAFFSEMPKLDNGKLNISDHISVSIPGGTINRKQVAVVGTLGRIVKKLKFPDGTMRILVRGISRVVFKQMLPGEKVQMAQVEKVDVFAEKNIKNDAMVRNAVKQFQEIVSYMQNFPEELKVAVLNLNDNVRTVDLIADTINIAFPEKLAILVLLDLESRLNVLTVFLNREVEVLRLGSEIQSQVHRTMSKNQREYFLREQLHQIKEELGEGETNPDVTSLTERMKKLNLPESVRDLLNKELERLNMIPQASGEYNIAYTYADWLVSVPWNVFTEDRLDVKEAKEILDADHYGLQDVKERILEFLSVLQLKKNRKAPIICFVGPPGVGKTSLGKSIASAMGRKFIRISLGGIKDEAEIRGHRRTYIGALPGRIIQGMKKAGSSNPVFMLDELDKVGNDYRGDPASALLEVLDPQQNSSFNDHYLEIDYDLSSVMFIATANLQDTIPGPLLDRMEIIRLPGYTPMEKHQIAKRYLIPRQMQENGLRSGDIRFTRAAVDEIITYYTIEAGVRNLERTIGTVCRKVARKIVENTIEAGSGFLVTDQEVRNLLGARKYLQDEAENVPQTGIATGMAWTSVGGSTLQVEASKMPGKGDLKLTGSLGDVMKESAMAAFSYVRSRSEQLGIEPDVFQKYDFHIHVPDGATPKDGPSAGVTLTTALVSLLTGKPVRPHLSMTGEITLRGKVTPVGGIKEKVIAALRYGIRDIIMPRENQKDLDEVPEEVKSQICFHFVSEIQEVLDIAFSSWNPDSGKRTERNAEDPDEIYTFTVADPEEEKKNAEKVSSSETTPELNENQSGGMPDNLVEKLDSDALDNIEKMFDPTDPEVIREMMDILQKNAEAQMDNTAENVADIPEQTEEQIKEGSEEKLENQYTPVMNNAVITVSKQKEDDPGKSISVRPEEQKSGKTSPSDDKNAGQKTVKAKRTVRRKKEITPDEPVKGKPAVRRKKTEKNETAKPASAKKTGKKSAVKVKSVPDPVKKKTEKTAEKTPEIKEPRNIKKKKGEDA